MTKDLKLLEYRINLLKSRNDKDNERIVRKLQRMKRRMING